MVTYKLNIDYTWGDEEFSQEFATWEEAWETAKKLAMEEAANFAYEHDDMVEMEVTHGKIDLFYGAWNESCRYRITPSEEVGMMIDVLVPYWDDLVTKMDDVIREHVFSDVGLCSNEGFLQRYLEIDPDFEEVLVKEFHRKRCEVRK